MNVMGLLATLLALLFCLAVNGVEGMNGISAKEELELEAQLKMLNKPPLQTVKTKEGDTIDCIDIYKQPSLDHPLLKDHKIRMRPTSFPTRSNDEATWDSKDAYFETALNSINCPPGTVPIRRTSKEDLIRAKSFSELFDTSIHPLTGITPGKHQAIVRSVSNPKIKYKGIESYISIYNPNVRPSQSSSAQMWIESGPPSYRNSLQVGWMVSPVLYGDNRTRSFTYWSMKGKSPKGCFNYLCAGFVQVDKSYTLGNILNISEYNVETQHCTHKIIFRDRQTGDWWLVVPAQLQYGDIIIGYWPKVLLPLLANGASLVAWGGQVIGTSNGPSPGMGNGLTPVKNDYRKASYVAQMKVVDTVNALIDPAGPKYEMETSVDSTCYELDDYGYNGEIKRFSFLFGGPGGNNCGK